MAVMRPDLSDEQADALLANPKKRAEAKFYKACREQLPDRIMVHYSVRMLNEKMVEGEADFVILDPRRGMLVVEVKGGGVKFEPTTGVWTSIDAQAMEHKIRDPFSQASDRFHDLHRMLSENERFRAHVKGRMIGGYAAFFPDLTTRQVNQIRRLDAPREIKGSVDDLTHIEEWIRIAFEKWSKSHEVVLGDQGLRVAEALICSPIYVRPLISSQLRDEESLRLQLTREQSLTLEILDGRERIAISGGAGTGKTLLAVTWAERLANAGKRVLLLCYNRALADHLKDVAMKGSTVHAFQFHQFCHWWSKCVSEKSGRDLHREADEHYPGANRITHQAPYALMLAVECAAPPYDAIIIDEGQDFTNEDWDAVDFLVESTKASLCVFHDHNQQFYRRPGKFPINDERDRYPLRKNCRNTMYIHDGCYKFYRGPPTEGPAISGEPVDRIELPTLEQQARALAERIRSLLGEEIRPEDIAVLILATEANKRTFYDVLGRLPILGGVSWAKETHRQERTILMDTVARFKGLERTIIFLWLGSDIDGEVHRELLYVGMSRAKSRLFLVGNAQACRAAHAEALNTKEASG